jgi:hypothetical protein
VTETGLWQQVADMMEVRETIWALELWHPRVIIHVVLNYAGLQVNLAAVWI